MEEWITLGQLLDVLNPDEPIDIFVTINQYMSEGLYEGVARDFPADYYEEYKDFPVIDFGTASNDDELDKDNIGLQITLVIPETYKYNNYTLKKILDTLDDTEVIRIYDANNPMCEYAFEGIKKSIPVDILHQIEDREVAFAKKIHTTEDENKLEIILQIVSKE